MSWKCCFLNAYVTKRNHNLVPTVHTPKQSKSFNIYSWCICFQIWTFGWGQIAGLPNMSNRLRAAMGALVIFIHRVTKYNTLFFFCVLCQVQSNQTEDYNTNYQ